LNLVSESMSEKRFARIITIKAKPGKGDAFVRRFKDGVASTAVDLKGMRRLYLMRPVGKKDEFVVVSLWDDQKAAEDYAKSGSNKGYADRLASVQEGRERVRKFHVELHVVGNSVGEKD